MKRFAITALLTPAVAFAQLPAVAQEPAPASSPVLLQNTGKPITIPFQCSLDDIHFAGLACTEEDPCPVFLELSAADGAGGRVFAAGNIHTEAVTLYSVLLQSEDGGHSWAEPSARVRGATLDHIQLLEGSGWISGQIAFPIAQDPFFLVTADNGATWQHHAIFSESGFGSILQFAFESRTSGTAILDMGPDNEGGRYARYESSDGGDSWAVKELNKKPITLKRPVAAASAWRVRADAALHAYRIEHRQGERWVSVADFAVKLPACKPE